MTLPEAMALMLCGSGSPVDTFDKINLVLELPSSEESEA